MPDPFSTSHSKGGQNPPQDIGKRPPRPGPIDNERSTDAAKLAMFPRLVATLADLNAAFDQLWSEATDNEHGSAGSADPTRRRAGKLLAEARKLQ